ncbi:hypothetical protein PIB30_056619 [Stylosanthes scabra]|uniref:Uncharacterized protein n=1 Tax=Stylosanthes scabra TaxID=79078 RepID=A0ABU6ZI39_9FABA|nr:hypothetical protein [Stylosanthes scabra]
MFRIIGSVVGLYIHRVLELLGELFRKDCEGEGVFIVFLRGRVSGHSRRLPRTGAFFQQALLSDGHGFRPFHRLGGDLYFPSLSLEELSQGSFHLLDVLVLRDHSLLRGVQRYVLVTTFVVMLSVHHLWLGGSAFVSQHDSKVYFPTDGANVKHRRTKQ